MSQIFKQTLASDYHFNSWLNLLPEVEEEDTPVYNPLLDLVLDCQYVISPTFYESFLGKTLGEKEYHLTFFEVEHEYNHSRLFNVNLRGEMQISAGMIYQIIHSLPVFPENSNGEDALRVPSFSNFPSFDNLRTALNIFFRKIQEVEEIFAFVEQLIPLKKLYNSNNATYPLSQPPKQIEALFREEHIDDANPRSKNFLSHYLDISRKIGAHRKFIKRFALNIPSIEIDMKEDSPVLYPDMIVRELEERLSKPRFSPLQRAMDVISVIESNYTDVIKSWTEDHFLSFIGKEMSGFIDSIKSYDQEFLPKIKRQRNQTTLYNKLMAELILTRINSWKEFDYNKWLQSVLRGDFVKRAEMNFKISPLKVFFHDQKFSIVTEEVQDIAYDNLIFMESLRQQIFEGKGLICPLRYMIDGSPTEVVKDPSSSSKYPYKEFLRDIWQNTAPDDDCIEWSKPECLDTSSCPLEKSL